MRRHDLRRKAVQALYQVDVGKSEILEAVGHVLEGEPEVTDQDRAYVTRLVNGTRIHIAEIDDLLTDNLQNWTLDRIAKVDLNVLRLAIQELIYEKEVDVATIMDEAVEVAKAFSTDESGKFVNGVLARVLPAISDRRSSLNS